MRVLGLMVPVHITVDVETYRLAHEQPPSSYSEMLEARLVAAAVLDTSTPDDVPGTPLSRLEGGVS